MLTSCVGPNTLDTNVVSLLSSEVGAAGALKKANRSHVPAMYHLFHHMLATKERGLVIEPNKSWDGSLDFLFEITGMSDANFAAYVVSG